MRCSPGKFDVTRIDGEPSHQARDLDAFAVGRAIRLGSLTLLVVAPASVALVAPDRELGLVLDRLRSVT